MSLIAWIVIGLAYGVIESKVRNKPREGRVVDALLGVAGSVAAGLILVSATGVDLFGVWTIVVAVFGAVAVVGINNSLMGSGVLRT